MAGSYAPGFFIAAYPQDDGTIDVTLYCLPRGEIVWASGRIDVPPAGLMEEPERFEEARSRWEKYSLGVLKFRSRSDYNIFTATLIAGSEAIRASLLPTMRRQAGQN